MLPATPAAPPPREPRRLAGPTKLQELQQRRAAFARRLLPLLRKLHRAGADTNRAVAERLNALGVATEHGGPWEVQTVASLRYRLLVLGASPPAARLPPLPLRHHRRGRRS